MLPDGIRNLKSEIRNRERTPIMMRKEAKIGFAVGGVLLAVLVVYVLVISGGEDRPAADQVTLATSTEGQTPAPAVDSLPPSQPQTQDPFRGPTDTTAAAPAQQTHPAETAPANDHWSAALNTGKLPVMMTETPVPAPSPAPTVALPGAVAAEANKPVTPPSAAPSLPIAASNAPASVLPASLTESSPATRPSGAARTHVVQQGETFSSIAASVYGNASYYPHIIRANPTMDPRTLRPGMTINLPAVSDVRPDAAPRTPASPAAAAPSLDPKAEYRVESGDSLYKISMKLYGKPDRADKIYELNKPTIGENPAKLKVGAVLKLPEAPTTAR